MISRTQQSERNVDANSSVNRNSSWRLVFDIQSFWQAGIGSGRGAWLDGLVRRDHNKLPVLPGRTVKGLVRDAVLRAEAWGHLASGCTNWLFGAQGVKNRITRLSTNPGILNFGNAVLPQDVSFWLAEQSEYREALFRELHSTAVNTSFADDVTTHPANEDTDNESQSDAKNRSLRGIEVTVPVTLYAPITVLSAETPAGEEWP
ncbi:MAG: hypothetical protein KJO08_08930, partial [Gammaproteobacteria bacterium]|nr:hypothetical protein [Gammaproteobacteria bacterium]